MTPVFCVAAWPALHAHIFKTFKKCCERLLSVSTDAQWWRHWGTVILQLDIFARVENIQILMTFRHLHSPSNEVYSTPYVGKCGWENLSRYGLTLVWTIFSNTLDVSDMREWFRGQHDSLKGHNSKWFAFWKVLFWRVIIPKFFISKGHDSEDFYPEGSLFERF